MSRLDAGGLSCNVSEESCPSSESSSLVKSRRKLSFWRTQSPVARVAAVEEIRREHHGWDHGAEPRLQRVFQSLNAHKVRYLVVGGFAVALHGHPRYTKDIDVESLKVNKRSTGRTQDQADAESLDTRDLS